LIADVTDPKDLVDCYEYVIREHTSICNYCI